VRDLVFLAFLGAFIALGFRRPFLFVLVYAYVDIVSPQRLTYYLLNSIPISMIAAVLAILGWLVADNKSNARFAPRQALILLLLVYCGVTMTWAKFPIDAAEKWDWVWKGLAFSAFLPLTLHTRLRIEALILTMILCAGSIIIVGGLKTATFGGGYGVLNLMVSNNSGLYESSIISTVAIAIVPLIYYMMRHGTIFPPEWRVTLFGAALCFACFLMPIGTEARTGLVCIAVLMALLLRFSKRRLMWVGLVGIAGLMALPMLPTSFTKRMDTIKEYKADESAGTRLAVWGWTWNYAKDHPFGGGFHSFRENKIAFRTVKTVEAGGNTNVQADLQTDEGRAFHSAYFEMLGEQGYPGLALWLLIQGIGLLRMEVIRRRYKDRTAEHQRWIAPLAVALQHAHIIYLVGALFVGIAFQPFIWMLIAIQIGFDTYVARRAREAGFRTVAAQARPGAAFATVGDR
jgi:probable O-glycosylation ligase (exosortase A-associated)